MFPPGPPPPGAASRQPGWASPREGPSFPTTRLCAKVGRVGGIRTPSLGPLLLPCASWVARDALSRSVTGQGLSGCSGAHELSVAGRTGTGVSSPQAQDSFPKQIWLKAA